MDTPMAYFNPQFKRQHAGNAHTCRPWIRACKHSLNRLDNNDEEAFRLNTIAAENGMHDAVLAMGWFYLNGVGVKANQQEATRWYKKSARQGHPRAMFSLGYIA
jgi:TPR repeat protein